MTDQELLNSIKQTSFFINDDWVKLPKISSFSVGHAGDAPTDNEILLNGINRKCIFLGLNPSAPLETDWGNFHIKSKTAKRKSRSFDHRIYYLLDKFPALKGIYMTDLGKGEIDGNSGSFIKKFRLEENKEYREKCFIYLKHELHFFNGKDTFIICMHGEVQKLLKRFSDIDYAHGYKNIVNVPHYAYSYKGYGNDDKFYEYAKSYWNFVSELIKKQK
jgi:hypothetical protein